MKTTRHNFACTFVFRLCSTWLVLTHKSVRQLILYVMPKSWGTCPIKLRSDQHQILATMLRIPLEFPRHDSTAIRPCSFWSNLPCSQFPRQKRITNSIFIFLIVNTVYRYLECQKCVYNSIPKFQQGSSDPKLLSRLKVQQPIIVAPQSLDSIAFDQKKKFCRFYSSNSLWIDDIEIRNTLLCLQLKTFYWILSIKIIRHYASNIRVA